MADAARPVSSLTVLGGPLNGKRFVWEPGQSEVRIGADPGCHLRLELAGMNALAARLRIDESGVTVHDEQSSGGVFVNDARVPGKRAVRDADVIWLGAPGDSASVMIQCRLAPPPLAAPAVEPLGADEFFVDEDSGGAGTFSFADEPRAVPASAPRTAAPMTEEPEVFFVDDASAFASDDFFVTGDEPTHAVPPPEPPPPSRPTAPPIVATAKPMPAAQPPRATAPPTAPIPVVKPTARGPSPAPPPSTTSATSVSAPSPTPAVPPARPASPPASPVSATAPQSVSPSAPVSGTPSSGAAPTLVPPAPFRAPVKAETPPRSFAAPAPARVGGSGPQPRVTAPTAPRPRVSAPAPRATKSPSKLPLYAGLAAVGAVVLGAGAYFGLRSTSRPEVLGVSPKRARIGEPVTLTGRSFAASPIENGVLFGDVPGVVREATPTRLLVEVPELPVAPGKDIPFSVTVRVGGRDSQPMPIAIFNAPRIHGLSPNVAMPGEEVTLAGSGWGAAAVVRFGELEAEVIENTPKQIRVRVPAVEGPPGTPAPVTVRMGADEASNPAPFLLGRLPLLQALQPDSAAPGDLIKVTGRGFHWKAAENVVRVGGVRAFVASASDAELKFCVPWASGPGGPLPVELRVPTSETRGEAVLTVQPGADPIEFRFNVEPLDVAGSPHAVLTTGLGPAFVLAAAGKRTAADRALGAQRRLNEAAGPLKASRDLNFEVRDLETTPVLALPGRPEAILEVTDEDAAAYNEDWTRLGGRGGSVTRARLALWWQAVARDLVLLLVRGEKPQYAAALSAEGRVLGEVFEAAKRTGRFGVPRGVIATARPPLTAALRTVAYRVPVAVTAAVPVEPQTAAPGPAPSGAPPLRLEGVWIGSELEGGARKYVTMTFRGRGGSLVYEGGISVSVPLLSVEQIPKDTVRYVLEFRGGRRYYLGQWDGQKIAGRISSDASGRGDVGAFELSPR